MATKFLAITTRLVAHDAYDETRECLASDWGALFEREALFAPFLPLVVSYEIPFERYAPFVVGVILSGGNDLAACNDNPLSQKRDAYEHGIIETAIAQKLPVLGICRGAQYLGQHFGASLIPCVGHIGEHAVSVGAQNFVVNSFHNYALSTLASPLVPLASAQDCTIEAFAHSALPLFGMMWHIEREEKLCDLSREIVGNFLQKCRDFAGIHVDL